MIIDIIFLILFGWAAYNGFRKGLVIQVASLAAFFLGIYGAIKFSGYISNLLYGGMHTSEAYFPIISFAIIFIAIVIIIHILARISEKIVEIIALGFINRIFGAIFNIIKYSLIISVFLVIMNNFDRRTPFLPKEQIQKSIFFTPLYLLAPLIYPYLRRTFIPIQKLPNNPVDKIPV
jgi:membrane protein required for colicin V production